MKIDKIDWLKRIKIGWIKLLKKKKYDKRKFKSKIIFANKN